MILFDSTIWIDYFKRRSNLKSDTLKQILSKNGRVFITPTIIQEVLQGISDENYFDVTEIVLTGQQVLEFNAVEAAVASAKMYASLRRKGITIRKPNDCLIASFALHFDVEICHNDSDFDLIATHTPLKIWKK